MHKRKIINDASGIISSKEKMRNWNAKYGMEYLTYCKLFLKRASRFVLSDFSNFRKRIFSQSGKNHLPHFGKNDILFKLQMINASKCSLWKYSRSLVAKGMSLCSNSATEGREANGYLGTKQILRGKKRKISYPKTHQKRESKMPTDFIETVFGVRPYPKWVCVAGNGQINVLFGWRSWSVLQGTGTQDVCALRQSWETQMHGDARCCPGFYKSCNIFNAELSERACNPCAVMQQRALPSQDKPTAMQDPFINIHRARK